MKARVLEKKVEKQDIETGIAPAARKQLSQGLVEALGSTYKLLVKTHVYHWNVVGPLFLPLHELTEEQYKELFEAADIIAERIRALGHPTPLAFEDFAPSSPVEEETRDRSAASMVAQLVADHETIARRLRELASVADEADDWVTADMLTDRLNFHEKASWMLRAIIAD